MVLSQFCFEVANGCIEGHELWIIDLRNIDPETMVDRGNKVEEVHGIDIERLTQIQRRIDRIHIDFRSNVAEFFPQHGANVEILHNLSGSCSSLPISAKNN